MSIRSLSKLFYGTVLSRTSWMIFGSHVQCPFSFLQLSCVKCQTVAWCSSITAPTFRRRRLKSAWNMFLNSFCFWSPNVGLPLPSFCERGFHSLDLFRAKERFCVSRGPVYDIWWSTSIWMLSFKVPPSSKAHVRPSFGPYSWYSASSLLSYLCFCKRWFWT